MPIINFEHVHKLFLEMKINEMRYYLDDLIKSLNNMEKEFTQRTEEQADVAFVLFNNHWQGYAPRNAVDIMKALQLPFRDIPVQAPLREEDVAKE